VSTGQICDAGINEWTTRSLIPVQRTTRASPLGWISTHDPGRATPLIGRSGAGEMNAALSNTNAIPTMAINNMKRHGTRAGVTGTTISS
jgi:hypothetical protein